MAEYEFGSMEMPLDMKLEVAQQGLWGLAARIVKIVDDKYGEDGLAALKEGLRDWDQHEANIPGMLAAFGIQPGEMSPAQFIQRVMNPYDDVSFIQKESPQIADAPDENRVMYKITSCSVADSVNREYPGLCRLLIESALEGQRRAAKADVRVTCDKYLCEGADACEFYVERVDG